jgi:hypothetical protein
MLKGLSLSRPGAYTLRAVSGSLVAGTAALPVAPTNHFGLGGLPAATSAGQQLTLMVTALDARGRGDSTYLGTIHFSSSDRQAGLPADYTFTPADNGQKTFDVTLKTAGTRTIIVRDVTRSLAFGARSVIVRAAAASALRVSGFPTTTVIGVSHPFTVTALDPFGNRATSYTGTVQFSLTGGTANLPPTHTFTALDKGTHVFKTVLTSLGSGLSLSATDTVTGSITGTESGITVVSPATHLLVKAPAGATAGVVVTLTVTALDALGHADALFGDLLHFTSSDPKAVLPPDGVFSGTGGMESFQVTLATDGTQTITITDLTRPGILPRRVTIKVSG